MVIIIFCVVGSRHESDTGKTEFCPSRLAVKPGYCFHGKESKNELRPSSEKFPVVLLQFVYSRLYSYRESVQVSFNPIYDADFFFF